MFYIDLEFCGLEKPIAIVKRGTKISNENLETILHILHLDLTLLYNPSLTLSYFLSFLGSYQCQFMSNTLSFSAKEKTLMSYTNGNAGNVIRNRTINGNFLIMLSKNFGIVLPLSSLIVKKYFGFNVY